MSLEKRKTIPVCSECNEQMELAKDSGVTPLEQKKGKPKQWVWVRRYECQLCGTTETKHDKQSVPLLNEQK